MKDKPLQFEPGSRFSYSNSNYELLGAVIEAVTGKSYEEVLRARLIEPLGLSSTGLDSDDLVLPRRASTEAEAANANQVARIVAQLQDGNADLAGRLPSHRSVLTDLHRLTFA